MQILRVCKDFDSKVKENDKFIQYNQFRGESDESEYVNQNKIIGILSDELNFYIDIDELLEQLEISKESLDFQIFFRLFRAKNKNSIKQNKSLLSILFYINFKSFYLIDPQVKDLLLVFQQQKLN
ncbi:unnamed protein product [Paramecium sonneborni]|uniref:Uncharacterized protein n=1 Tax=Paramecium sonneborni TaxID=65129 RepID=A0A8S1P0M9_9CILI|nr:unnamed protein product [Paramecium sonneborni]